MSTSTPRPLAAMRAAAEAIVRALTPFVERIEIAGSIRRRRRLCSDIEIVCVPKIEQRRVDDDLFGKTEPVNLLDVHVSDEHLFTRRLDRNRRTAFGERYKRLAIRWQGMPIALDLFSVLEPATSWGVIFLIRTGSSDFSRAMVTKRRMGGRLPDDLRVENGAIWRDGERLNIPEERDWFNLCGTRFVEPERRG
jgi:DNA polymerase/3'-5' exonuclease PolX